MTITELDQGFAMAPEIGEVPSYQTKIAANIALIGCGQYARSCYIDYFLSTTDSRANLRTCVDLESESGTVDAYLGKFRHNERPTPIYLADEGLEKHSLFELLDEMSEANNINAVILSTPPDKRRNYIEWALMRGIHILSDKPLTSTPRSSIEAGAAKQIFQDYQAICELYKDAIKKNPDLVFDLMVQRRFHPVFQLMLEKINEVADYTGCAVSHFQSTHADGQWRLPGEVIELDYHGYADGTGKASHSGYHFFDLVTRFVSQSAIRADKTFDGIEVFSQPTFPRDLLEIMGYDSYRKVFGDEFDKVNPYSEDEYLARSRDYGEVDCATNISFTNQGRRLVNGNVNLLHTSFSGRYWAVPALDDLYRSNGRLRQELHFFVQGPFQSISLSSLRGCSKVGSERRVPDTSSGTEPLVVEIFRNKGINSAWNAYERYHIGDLIPDLKNPDAHLGWSRRKCISDFITNIICCTPRTTRTSDLFDHNLSTQLYATTCESIASSGIVSARVGTTRH